MKEATETRRHKNARFHSLSPTWNKYMKRHRGKIARRIGKAQAGERHGEC